MTPLIEKDASNTTLAVYTKVPSAPGGIGGLISSYDNTNTLYYHDSNLGNVNQITNSSGVVIQTYDYDAFGNITSQQGSLTNAYQYKTKEYSHETGLVFFGSRYYNPLIGRFITKDPSGMVDGPNQYIYCWNDPINRIDPWGLACEGIDQKIKDWANNMMNTLKNIPQEPNPNKLELPPPSPENIEASKEIIKAATDAFLSDPKSKLDFIIKVIQNLIH